MSERKLFWLSFIGGVIRIFGILLLLLTAYAAIGVVLSANWQGILPLLIAASASASIYFLGKRMESISG